MIDLAASLLAPSLNFGGGSTLKVFSQHHTRQYGTIINHDLLSAKIQSRTTGRRIFLVMQSNRYTILKRGGDDNC